ncbi:MAG TPA: DUF3667 domain-containing protein [Ideonella sp.]|uniref:DUF3667 domain-containing protein n=1 Tax=Ideonella sp. TaxID=1929293 RepID=UPI002D0CCB7D|nr:DUF3667 domain-containing protein [Ideonella sp.]HSI48104.1 DUF3667 domain-containing protein [Ideonella sp.]
MITSQPLPSPSSVSPSHLHHGHARSPHCRNCQQDLTPLPDADYCPRCGQETVLHPPSFTEFVHEFITHYVALEGALWRTLRMLLTQPGQLTREYFHGKRRHFVLPLRLYLTASFIFFLVLKLTGDGPHVNVGPNAVRLHKPAAAASAASTASTTADPASDDAKESDDANEDDGVVVAAIDESDLAQQRRCLSEPASCGWLDRLVANMTLRAGKAKPAAMTHQFTAMAPYAIFLMLPFFATLMKLAYVGRRRTYGEHFVFSLHVHSFWFVALLAEQLLPAFIAWLPVLAIPAYGYLAMRKVYDGHRLTTLWRALLVSAAYGLLLAVVAGGLGLWVLIAG